MTSGWKPGRELSVGGLGGGTAPKPQPLDPELARIVDAMRAAGALRPFSGSAPLARERMAVAIHAARARHGVLPVAAVKEGLANGVPVRIYQPEVPGPLATVVFFHGGGFVLGSVALMDDIARKLCRDLRAVVVSVDYRLAPEHPYPAAHDDALAAVLWAREHASSLGGDAHRLAVAGESAGANLAASVALQCRDLGRPLAAQLLIVPGVDMARDVDGLEASRCDYPMLTPADLRDIRRLYMAARDGEAGAFPPSPMRAGSLAGLPPAVVAVAGHDPLHDEGVDYAGRLARAGVPVRLLRYGDMFHPFFGFFEASAAARSANDEICRGFQECLEAIQKTGAQAPGDSTTQENAP